MTGSIASAAPSAASIASAASRQASSWKRAPMTCTPAGRGGWRASRAASAHRGVRVRLRRDVPAVRERRLRPDRAEDQRVLLQERVPGPADGAPLDQRPDEPGGVLLRIQLTDEVEETGGVGTHDLAQQRFLRPDV